MFVGVLWEGGRLGRRLLCIQAVCESVGPARVLGAHQP